VRLDILRLYTNFDHSSFSQPEVWIMPQFKTVHVRPLSRSWPTTVGWLKKKTGG